MCVCMRDSERQNLKKKHEALIANLAIYLFSFVLFENFFRIYIQMSYEPLVEKKWLTKHAFMTIGQLVAKCVP